MVFNSTVFLIFFLLFYGAYWIINNRFDGKIRNLFIIIASYIFYGWWDWRFLGLILISSATDYWIGLAISKATDRKRRKLLLYGSLLVNLGILGFFKYFNFFVDSFVDLLSVFSISVSTSTLSVILPVGISFYTFQTLSYTIDIYKGKLEPTRDPFAFFAFVSFFPQLVAGPIERASHLLPQFNSRKIFNYNEATQGLRLMLWGFFKKIVIADNFGMLADSIFQPEVHPTGLVVLFGAICFSLQIYADFSGYSDIAIGVARMLGFQLMQNFSTPYFSSSFREFWQRWHISLSTWFRDYVYIPLGGNRGTTSRIYLNLLITFIISGLWHGASITFVLWGFLHGLMLIIEKQFKPERVKWLYSIVVIFGVILLWIPFRAQTLGNLSSYVNSLVAINSYSFTNVIPYIQSFSVHRFAYLMAVLSFFLVLEAFMKRKDFSTWIAGKPKIMRYTVYYVLLLLILLIGNFSVKPSFIYFQF